MSALLNTAENAPQEKNNPITSISTNARIDYILRFSKQAILVVDDKSEVYTQIAGQYVGSLSGDHNTSLLTVSSRHNNIQVRCRIIEQLFGNVLFDPEQPLAVSILNFAKKHNEAVSIVLEQAQNISLQLFHELCQLVEMGKKANIEINVLMVGNLDAGSHVAQNKPLFKGKLSILSAQSGQLLSINHPMFKKQGRINFAKIGYALLGLSLTVLITVLGALALDKYELINLEQILNSAKTPEEASIVNKDIDSQFVLPIKNKVNIETIEAHSVNVKQAALMREEATNQDIFNALNTVPAIANNQFSDDAAVKTTQRTILETSVDNSHVVRAFSAPTEEKINVSPESLREQISVGTPVTPTIIGKSAAINKNSIFPVEPTYYQSKNTGFAIQISAFTTLKAYQEYIETYPNLAHKGYLKIVGNREMMIMTSPVFESRSQAEQELTALPFDVQKSGIWIKSVAAINAEISAFSTSVK